MGMDFLVRAIGFYNDAYDLFVMNIINIVLEYQYPNEYTHSIKSLCSTAVLCGSVFGQLVFGYIADQLGRKKIMICTAFLLIIGGLLCTTVYAGNNITLMFYLLAAYRCLLGIGIGGEYPLSSTFTAEKATTAEKRGKNVCSTFAMQGVGQLTAALFGNILIQCFALTPEIPNTTSYNKKNLEIIWRLLFALGVIPCLTILYPRIIMEESEHFNNNTNNSNILNNTINPSNTSTLCCDVNDKRNCYEIKKINNNNTIIVDKNNLHNVSLYIQIRFILKYYGTRLLGTAGSWFLFDIVFYSQSIFSGTILKNENDLHTDTLQIRSLKLIFLALGALPGYYVAIYYINKIGRKRMQLQGFMFMTIIFFILAIFWSSIINQTSIFILLYGLTFFFSNFGPNTTTFLLPVESFPTSLRATCHGFSAASGKIGAALGTALFVPIQSEFGTKYVFLLCGCICLLCLPLTYFFVQDRMGDLYLLEEELQNFINREKLDHHDIARDSIYSLISNNNTNHSISMNKPMITESNTPISQSQSQLRRYNNNNDHDNHKNIHRNSHLELKDNLLV